MSLNVKKINLCLTHLKKAVQRAVVLWRFMKMCVFLTAPQSSAVVSLVRAFGPFQGVRQRGGRTPRPQLDVSTCSPTHLLSLQALQRSQPALGDLNMSKNQVKCDFLAQTHLWVAERERESYFYAICCRPCMYAWRHPRSGLYVTWCMVSCHTYSVRSVN